MADCDAKDNVNSEKEPEWVKEKVILFSTKHHVVDEENIKHPWYLFPQEDFGDLSDDSLSDNSSHLSINEGILGERNEMKNKIVPSDKSYSKEENKKLKCSFCEKTYKKKGHLERHLLNHSSPYNGRPSVKVHECAECGYQASCIGNYKKHHLIHTDERPFECNICKKSFRQKVHLKDHVRSHTGERDFECEDCGATFVQKSSLKLHERKHSGIRPFTCDLCQRSFFENQHLVNHRRTHTGEKPYQCETCGQTFSTLRILKTHKMIHTGERPFKCETCGVSFREKTTLQKHRAVHINVGPFPCTECGKEFNRLASLTLHSKIHSHDASKFLGRSVNNNSHFEKAALNEDTSDSFIKAHANEKVETSVEKSLGEVKINNGRNTQKTPDLIVNAGSLTPVGAKQSACQLQGSQAMPVYECSEHKSPTNILTGIDNIECPDFVNQALEYGTVWETKDDDGNNFIIVLPALLSNKNLILTTPNSKAIIPCQSAKTLPFKTFSETHENTYALELPKESSGNMVTAPEKKINKREIVEEPGMNSILMDETHNYSDNEILDIEIFPTSSVDNYHVAVKSFKSEGEIIQDVHSKNNSLFLWDDETVTYIIQEGKGEAVKLSPSKDGVSGIEGSSSKSRKKKGNYARKMNTLNINDISLKKVKKERMLVLKLKEKKVKTKSSYVCQQCGKACKTSSNFITHMRTHSGERPYICDVCGVGFKQIAHLKAHVRIHTGEKPYVCGDCGASFTQTSRLSSHKKSQHGKGRKLKAPKIVTKSKIRNFYCHICKKTFLDECFKRDHMREHRKSFLMEDSLDNKDNIVKGYHCDICGIVYKNKNTLNKHRLGHVDFKSICEICGLSFQDTITLQSHISTVHGIKMEPEDVPGMYINVKIGTDEDFVVVNPSIKCVLQAESDMNAGTQKVIQLVDDVCENREPAIRVTETLDGHNIKLEEIPESDNCFSKLSEQDADNVDKPKAIKVEGTTLDEFLKDEGLLNEVVRDNEEVFMKKPRLKFDYMDSEGRKVWECKLCKKIFFQSSNLHCHMRSHTGEKPYKCNMCPKAFKQITHLKEHMHKHTGLKSFGCSTCGAHFSQRGAVKRHIAVIHGGHGTLEKVCSFAERKVNLLSVNKSLFVRVRSNKPGRKRTSPQVNLAKKSCPVCGKEFFNSYINKHLRCHTGEKPYQCKVCKELFRQKSHLNTHVRRHLKEFTCNCGIYVADSTEFESHRKTCDEWQERVSIVKGSNHIDKEKQNSEIKLETRKNGTTRKRCFQCSHCNLSFPSTSLLETHRECCPLSSDSESSVMSDYIPYQDESSDEEIAIGRKHSRKSFNSERKIQKARKDAIVEKSLATEDSRTDDLNNEKSGISEGQVVCKLCGAQFRRTSALKFHYRMKHGNLNEDGSDEDVELVVKDPPKVNRNEKSTPKTVKNKSLANRRKGKVAKQTEEQEKDQYVDCERSVNIRKRKQRGESTGKQENGTPKASKKKSEGQASLHCNICNISFQKACHLALHIGSRHQVTKRVKKKK